MHKGTSKYNDLIKLVTPTVTLSSASLTLEKSIGLATHILY